MAKKPERNSTSWGKGQSGNPRGAPRGVIRRTKSELRKILDDFMDIQEEAKRNIKESIQGKDVDRESLNTSKWLITTMVTLNRAAIAEEQLTFNVRAYQEEQKRQIHEQKEGTTGNVIKFSTKMLDNSDEED